MTGARGRAWLERVLTRRADRAGPALLGCVLVRRLPGGEVRSGRIVEVEAYVAPEDAASHAAGGRRTRRNEAMYGRAGLAYVYFTYGMHWCFNIVCRTEGVAHAVLVRALEPLEGIDGMRRARANGRDPGTIRDRDLCSGPAKTCRALAIDGGINGTDLLDGSGGLGLEPGEPVAAAVRCARIGVEGAGPVWARAPLRWYERGNAHVSVRDRAAESDGSVG